MSKPTQIQDIITGAAEMVGLSGQAFQEGDTAVATMCAQQSIAGSLLAIATILDRVTRHGEAVDVKIAESGY